MGFRQLSTVAAACVVGACAARKAATQPGIPERVRASAPPPSTSVPADAPAAPGAPPAGSAEPDAPTPAHFADLPVPGHEPARLWVPGGSDTRPLIVVAHGAGGRAAWHCDLWRGITRGRAFVLCPRGTRVNRNTDSGYFFANDPALEKEVLAAVQAARASYPRVDPGPAVYAGYSQGAIMGALMAHRHPALFPRLVLVEGGHDWDIPTARRWHDGGGRRVLFVCGRRVCDEDARRASGWLGHVGVQTRIEYAAGAGHTPSGRVADRVRAAFDWVVQGDDRW